MKFTKIKSEEYCGGRISKYSFEYRGVPCTVRGGTHRMAIYGDWTASTEAGMSATSGNSRKTAVANLCRELDRELG